MINTEYDTLYKNLPLIIKYAETTSIEANPDKITIAVLNCIFKTNSMKMIAVIAPYIISAYRICGISSIFFPDKNKSLKLIVFSY